jgi:predicted nucleotidyltransferase
MSLTAEYQQATRDAELARLRRVLAVRAMLVEGESQREIAARLGVTQPAVSYQVAAERTSGVRPRDLLAAGGSILRQIVERRGFTELASFGSAAREEDRPDSDIDLLVQPPDGADLFDMIQLEEALGTILGRHVDLVSYGGLNPHIDGDILRDKVLL